MLWIYCGDKGSPLPDAPWPVNFFDVNPPKAISAEFCRKVTVTQRDVYVSLKACSI